MADAKAGVLQLIKHDIEKRNLDIKLDYNSSDREEGKFLLEGRPARAIQPFNSFHVNINLDWFNGSMESLN